MTSTIETISSPPRDVTPAARRRAWAEPGVRLWWMSAIVVALVVLYLVAARSIEQMQRASLLNNGIAVTARIEQIVGRHQQTRGTQVPVQLSYTLPDGREYVDVAPVLLEATSNEEVLHVDDPLPIRVDAQNPARWTEDRPQRPIFASIGMAAALVPLVLLLLILAWIKRQGVLAVWRDGMLTEATVLGQKSSAWPGTQLLSITLTDDAESRVVTLQHPRKAGLMDKGDTLAVIAPPGKPHKAIEAKLYG